MTAVAERLARFRALAEKMEDDRWNSAKGSCRRRPAGIILSAAAGIPGTVAGAGGLL